VNNPYRAGGPLGEAGMFHDREHELEEISAFLRANQSISIIGPRRIGKTSLLLHLLRTATRTALQLNGENLLVYIDCHAISQGRYEEILGCFCDRMAEILHAQGLQPESALQAALTKPGRPEFEAAIRGLNQRGLRVVLLLDAFEQLACNPHAGPGFYNALRSAAGRLRLVYLTASARPLIELTYCGSQESILSSPFFNIFAQLPLGLLGESAAHKLIREPMQAGGILVSTELEDFIYRLAGRHPLALQAACFHAWNNPYDLQQIETNAKRELEAHFKDEWERLSPGERVVLQNPVEASGREAGDPALRQLFRALRQKCLLVQADGSYEQPSQAWADFVAEQAQEPCLHFGCPGP
jgi:hypothetical protein